MQENSLSDLENCNLQDQSSEINNSKLDESEDGSRVVEIHFSKKEFDDLLDVVERKRYEKENGLTANCVCLVLKKCEWQNVVQKKLWEKQRVSCGYNFKSHKIFMNSNRGSFDGHCKCGGSIFGEFKDLDKEIITSVCTITKGKKKCGKRYCRNPERKKIARELHEKNICPSIYRPEKADEIMDEGDPEPGHLYSAKVLRDAKNEYAQELLIHKDPILALAILQTNDLKNVIRFLSLNPFLLHFWSNYQIKVYKTYCETEDACLILDATGGIVRKV